MADRNLAAFAVLSVDVDGTLYDAGDLRLALRRRVHRAVWSGRWWSLLRGLWGLARHQWLMRAIRREEGRMDGRPAHWDSPSYHHWLEAWLLPAIGDVGPSAPVMTLLDEAASRGLKLVATSDFDAREKLAVLGLTARFDAVVAGERLGCLKPQPAVLKHVADACGVSPVHILHVGDRDDTDGLGARRVGAGFLHVTEVTGGS